MNGEFSVAVHALVYLNHRAQTVSSELLSENICTNPARVRKVMARLKKAGLVSTKEGSDGGYFFQLPPESVSLAQIGRALDMQFVSPSWRSGDSDMDCLVASGMAGIMDDIYARLDALCYRDLEKITIRDIDVRIFGTGK